MQWILLMNSFSLAAHWSWFSFQIEFFKVVAHYFPVNAGEKVVTIVGFVALIVYQVGMFPHVDANYRDTLAIDDSMHQWIVLIVSLCDE